MATCAGGRSSSDQVDGFVHDGTLGRRADRRPHESAIDAPSAPGSPGASSASSSGHHRAVGIGALTQVTAEIRVGIALAGALLLLSGVDKLLKH